MRIEATPALFSLCWRGGFDGQSLSSRLPPPHIGSLVLKCVPTWRGGSWAIMGRAAHTSRACLVKLIPWGSSHAWAAQRHSASNKTLAVARCRVKSATVVASCGYFLTKRYSSTVECLPGTRVGWPATLNASSSRDLASIPV